MASTKICPNCGAKNPSANRFCEDCGCDMNKVASSPAPKVTLFCPLGHTVSNPELGFCGVCGEKLTPEMPVPPAEDTAPVSNPFIELPVVPPTPLDPPAGKKCPSCGAMNPEDNIFCQECAANLTAAPTATSTPGPSLKPSFRPAPTHDLPDIPDIMRTLTNNDMKR